MVVVESAKHEIAQTAYVKLVLHALKHTTSAVNGVLIGRVQGSSSEGGDLTVEILDAIPLFHSQLALLPMLEMALLQVDEYLASGEEGLQIVGYYHANERFDDCELSTLARKIGDHMVRYCPQAVILLVDNKLLGSLDKSGSMKPVVQLYLRDPNRGWRQVGQSASTNEELVLKEPTANSILMDYILEGRNERVVDFDEHLDDITKDWLNRELFN